MSYVRKTKDIFQLWVKYGDTYGWEHELDEYTWAEITTRKREYQENCPQYPVKIVRKREPINKEEK